MAGRPGESRDTSREWSDPSIALPTIPVHTKGSTLHIPSGNVYFAFASGRFAYNCVTCGAKCCRGFGFNANAGSELLVQVRRRPQLSFFVNAEANSRYPRVQNLPPACFFLNEHGLCNIHRTDGYRAKPETCRLFPFNNIVSVGEYMIVMPHAGLCPLEVVATPGTIRTSSHSVLLAEMVHGVNARPSQTHLQDQSLEDVVKLERRVVSLSEEYLASEGSFADFTEAQVLTTRDVLATEAALSCSDGEETSVAEGVVKCASEVLAIDFQGMESGANDVRNVLLAMTPYLRAEMLFRRQAHWPGGVSTPHRMPFVILITYLVTQIARYAGMAHVTFQTVSGIFKDHRPLIELLSYLKDIVVWRDGRTIDVVLRSQEARFQREYLRVIRALLPGTQQRQRRDLSSILIEHNRWSGVDRYEFLRMLGTKLEGKIVPAVAAAGANGVRKVDVRSYINRWFVDNMNERLLVEACGRVARNQAGRRVAH